MGDRRRTEIFGEFLLRNFPRVKSAMVVADGKDCRLAAFLAQEGIRSVAVDPKSRNNHRGLVKIIREPFFRNMRIEQELIVGMHADHATAEIVVAAQTQGKPFVVVPCCLLGPEAKGVQGIGGWIAKLQSMAESTFLHQLDMRGRNIAIGRR